MCFSDICEYDRSELYHDNLVKRWIVQIIWVKSIQLSWTLGDSLGWSMLLRGHTSSTTQSRVWCFLTSCFCPEFEMQKCLSPTYWMFKSVHIKIGSIWQTWLYTEGRVFSSSLIYLLLAHSIMPVWIFFSHSTVYISTDNHILKEEMLCVWFFVQVLKY